MENNTTQDPKKIKITFFLPTLEFGFVVDRSGVWRARPITF